MAYTRWSESVWYVYWTVDGGDGDDERRGEQRLAIWHKDQRGWRTPAYEEIDHLTGWESLRLGR